MNAIYYKEIVEVIGNHDLASSKFRLFGLRVVNLMNAFVARERSLQKHRVLTEEELNNRRFD